ncbi:B-cell linker protein isoform X3 [Hemicordylus capensis]|uniref:B-cell linker protein isoform X3 n=2 Tax=Hemicordylus capensis TaxID=884348 RepID=UPI00230368B9|nr:B-cell linker protein isoform X3 [Hemicordylus capensis]
MATKLPFREDCENWTALQVADLLRQCGMQDCARIVEKLNIDGAQFLNLSEYERNRFSIMDQPQLQKIVHDIKKNDSGIMSKFKKLTSKPPPSVPPVDYVPENADDEEHWSDFDSDYENPDSDSEMYVVPTEENCEDSYEPPPSEKENKKIPPAFSFPTGEYIDNQHQQQHSRPITKPLPNLPMRSSKPKTLPTLPTPSAAPRPKIPPKQKECTDEEADYVVPVDDEDDNYIEPTEESSSQPVKPPVNRNVKPTLKLDPPSNSALPPPPPPVSPSMQDVYEIPEEEEKASPPLPRISKPLPPKPAQRPGRNPQLQNPTTELSKPDIPRNILPLPRNYPPPKIEPDGFEIQDDENHNSNGAQEFKPPPITVPSPFPRITKKLPIPAVPSKPGLPDRDHLSIHEDKPIPAERRRGSSHDIPLPPIPSSAQKPLPPKPPVLLRSGEPANRTLVTPRNSIQQGGSNILEQNADVSGRAWYMASSDRKTAEDALYRSNKDGSFLVRKSSGQDSKQPFTLVVLYNNKVYNIPIRFIESTRQYALGREKSGEERFDSVAEIIENHQRHSLVLIDSQNNTKDSTKLKHITRVS